MEILGHAALVAAHIVEAAACAIVVAGAAISFYRLVALGVGAQFPQRRAIYTQFGMWLLMGLEFELAADIIRSAISPSWTDIAQLGSIAVIRTFLNYFLSRDIDRYLDTSGSVSASGK